MKPGMRLGEALATCPSLVLVDRDPAAVEREWEGVLRRLEDSGFAVEPVEQGAVVFETSGVERLYGGVQPALERALAAVGSTWDPRRRGRQALHRPRGGERRAARSDPAGRGAGGTGVPRAASALAPADDAEPLRGARGARPALARGAGAASRRSGRGAAGGGGEEGLAARARRPESTRARAQARLGARRGARSSRRRLRTSSRCDGRSAPSSSACSRVQNGPGGRFENSRWSPGSSTAARGGV